MEIRDASEEDIPRLSAYLDVTTSAVSEMIRYRTVRVIEGEESREYRGMVSFDVTPNAVHIAWLAGMDASLPSLIAEPVRFGTLEGMPVEMVVCKSENHLISALKEAGFERIGGGPTFRGESTVVFRLPTQTSGP